MNSNRKYRYRSYKRMSKEEIELIFKLYEEKMELRKATRLLGRSLSSIQYQLRKKMKMYKEFYNKFIILLKKSNLVFLYICLDKFYTFYGKKENRLYVWSTVGVIKTGRKFYFLSKKKNIESLLTFNFDLPEVDKYYTDGHFAYSNVYGKKAATQTKSRYTNIVKNLNLQMRDKISYLVRKTKSHAKSFDWLDHRLAMFFLNLNIKENDLILLGQCKEKRGD